MKETTTLLFILLTFMACKATKFASTYQTETLKIQQLSPNLYVHISYLATKSYGNVPCNGMIYVANDEAIIFDTPVVDSVSVELIEYVEQKLKAPIKAVVVNHFHVDCLGGLNAFHQHGVASYANDKTIELAKQNDEILPQNGFSDALELTIGDQKVINTYFGEGHTPDNIVSYIPNEKALFGGCMVKSLNAGKGNLADANVSEWSQTVGKVKATYPDLKYVVPGHGKTGGTELLDFTADLFSVTTP